MIKLLGQLLQLPVLSIFGLITAPADTLAHVLRSFNNYCLFYHITNVTPVIQNSSTVTFAAAPPSVYKVKSKPVEVALVIPI